MRFWDIVMTAATQGGGAAAAADAWTDWFAPTAGKTVALTGEATPGTAHWTAADFNTVCTTSDDVRAQCGGKGALNSHTLRLSGFGLDGAGGFPLAATPVGVEVEIEKSLSAGTSTTVDLAIYLITAATDNVSDRSGSNKASAVVWPSATDAVTTYGGLADIWSATLTDTIIRSAAFGVDIRVAKQVTIAARVDFVRMRVRYST